MNAWDVILIVIALTLLVRGYLHGLVRGAGSLIGLILAVFLASKYQASTSLILREAMGPADYLDVLAFGAIFIAVLIVVAFVGRLIQKFVAQANLTQVDKLAGLVIGAGKAAVLAVVLTAAATAALGPKSKLIAHSRLAPYALQGAEWALNETDGKLNKTWRERKQQLEHLLERDSSKGASG